VGSSDGLLEVSVMKRIMNKHDHTSASVPATSMTLSLGHRSVLSPTAWHLVRLQTFTREAVSLYVRGTAGLYVSNLLLRKVSNLIRFHLLLVTTRPDKQELLIVSIALPLRIP
jgi:hypothetical protein